MPVVSNTFQKACQLIRYTLAIEAFVGVIFASFCSAILFTKIQRVEYSANVMFSSCLCLQYGEGVTDAKVDVLQSVGVRILSVWFLVICKIEWLADMILSVHNRMWNMCHQRTPRFPS